MVQSLLIAKRMKGMEIGGLTISFPKSSPTERVTERLKEHLLASYYGINSFNASERYILVLETDIWDQNPTTYDVAVLGPLDLKTKKFSPIAKTRAWNFQRGVWHTC